MMRAIDTVSTLVLLVMGVGHTALTPAFAPGWTPAALWFAGSGLAIALLGLLNAARLRAAAAVKPLAAMSALANLVALAWIAWAIVVLAVPQAYVVAVAVAGTTVSSIVDACRGARQA
jgi:hypothetical protein